MMEQRAIVQVMQVIACLLVFSDSTEAFADEWPGDSWRQEAPANAGMNQALLEQARDYALTGGGSGYITRHGKLVMSWGDPDKTYDLKSTSKSIGGTMLALAIQDGKVNLDDVAVTLYPTFGVPPESNLSNDWRDKITLRQLANQTAGFEKPGGYGKLLFAPGAKWHYSDGGPNWLAECLTLAYQRDLEEILFERVFTPIGIARRDLRWRNHQYRPHLLNGVKRREFGSGVHANVDAMARIGYLYLREGRWNTQQLLPTSYIKLVRQPSRENTGLPEHDTAHGNASDHYSLLWWNNGDGSIEQLPRDAYWSWGLHESLIVVIPSLDIVVARAGRSWKHNWDGHYDVLKPFLEPISRSVAEFQKQSAQQSSTQQVLPAAPYPRSPVIKDIIWSDASTVLRRAKGSDNWPVTWADDDAMYTAYGDGKGFQPFVEHKLSMGLARIDGMPGEFRGVNLRSAAIESRGDGKAGYKASGILMVDGVLYLLARNRGNSQLAWSNDHGLRWNWADWKFTRSFGCPTFLNFGKNYGNARDGYVYIYSPDNDSAYIPADRMVLARVPKTRLADRAAYEFFQGLDAEGVPGWTSNIENRQAVFNHADNCYRGGISYHAALNRYLWCQVLPASRHPQGPRFQGGFGIYDAAEPWGPWTTAFYTNAWDIGPGETSTLPTKWMGQDGKTLHLVFSGDDCFSVRRGEIINNSE